MPSRPSVAVELTAEQLRTLADLAHFYEKSMGPFRVFVRLTAGRETRRRFHFVADESRWLGELAEATYQDLLARGGGTGEVRLTPRSLVAFWGRVLASLNTRRSRRKLSEEEITRREELAATLEEAARRLKRRDPAALEGEVATRRPIEAEWMRERLAGGPPRQPYNAGHAKEEERNR